MPFLASFKWYMTQVHKKLGPGQGEEGTTEDHASLLPTTKEMDSSENSHESRCRRCQKSTSNYVVASIMALLICILFYYVMYGPAVSHKAGGASTSHQSRVVRYLHCGSGDPVEARKLGCRFELMSYSWMPELCIDQELEEEFQKLGFEYFEDLEATRPLSHTAVLTGERIVYASWGEHMWHCSFMWKKLVKLTSGMRGSGGLTKAMLRLNHTEHCLDKIMEEPRVALDFINTKGTPHYGECLWEENPLPPFLDHPDQ